MGRRKQYTYDHRAERQDTLGGIDFSVGRAQGCLSAAERLNAVCSLCHKPHTGYVSSREDEKCTQGGHCAASFSKDGQRGMAHYGSGFDSDVFRPRDAQRARLAGLDPVCDACLGAMILRGQIDNVGSPGEFGGAMTLPKSDKASLAAARAYALELFTYLAGQRGRPAPWADDKATP